MLNKEMLIWRLILKSPESVFAFVETIIKKCSEQFPVECSTCGREFRSFRDFIRGTKPIAAPQSLFKEGADPIGMLSCVNCQCGNTLALKCEEISGNLSQMFRETIASQAQREGKSPSTLLIELRSIVRETALSRPN